MEAVFTPLHYGMGLGPEFLAQRAYHESHVDSITLAECEQGVADCFDRDLIRVVTPSHRSEIQDDLASRGVLGPVYGLPDPGLVDFTSAGAKLYRWLREPVEWQRDTFLYPLVKRRLVQVIGPVLDTCQAQVETLIREEPTPVVSSPRPIGCWRMRPWRTFARGFVIDITIMKPNRANGIDSPFAIHPFRASSSEIPKLLSVLQHHGLTIEQWASLAKLDEGLFIDFSAIEGVSEECRSVLANDNDETSVQTCLRQGWILEGVPILPPSTDEVWSPLPLEGRRALRWLTPPATNYLLQNRKTWSYSKKGLQLYETITDDWLGKDWQLGISASTVRLDVDYYCESLDLVDLRLQEFREEGWCLADIHIEPIGPWCVHWWNTRSRGYRVSLTQTHA